MKHRLSFLVFFALVIVGWLVVRHWPTEENNSVDTAMRGSSQSVAAVAEPTPHSRSATTYPAVAIAATATGDSRAVIGAGWATTEQPEFRAFQDWTSRYLAAPTAERAALHEEGVRLAQARRAVLADLIRTDPRAALMAAVPMVVRQDLPTEITAWLETRISGDGELALNGVTPEPGHVVTEPMFRAALIGREEYRAYVYGRRALQDTIPYATLSGIAIDRALAVSDSPLRLLEEGERVSAQGAAGTWATCAQAHTAAPVAVQYGDKVEFVCVEHLVQLEQFLMACELHGDTGHTAADSQPGTSGVSNRPAQSWTHGPKKILIIRIDFSDLVGTPKLGTSSTEITEDFAINLFNEPNGIRDFFATNSYGKSTLALAATVAGDSPDVTQVLRVPSTAASYASNAANTLLHSDARTVATAAGYDLAAYDRIGVVFSRLSALPGSQITYGGLGNITGKNFWINGSYNFRVVAHEVGHTYGLRHANLWLVNDGDPISAGGTSIEYGDIFDLMGDGNEFSSEFSHWNKSILQWIPDTGVTLAAAPGTYRIYRFDAAAANLANARALKIVRDNTRDYWIGYRRGSGATSLDGGAYVLWGYNTNQESDLLDMTTPGANVSDAGLAIGVTFTDAVAGITIRPVAQGGSGAEEYLDVAVGLQPIVQWSRASWLAAEQNGTVTLTLVRSRNAVGALSVNYATVAGTATSPADFAAQSGTITWHDGDSSNKTITITLVADGIFEGTENFTVTLSGVTGGLLGPNNLATVTIVDPGVRDTEFASDFINSTVGKLLPLPDGSIVLGGFFSQVQDAQFAVYNRGGVTRLLANGTLDAAFAAGGGAETGAIYDLARQPDGRILAVGSFTDFSGVARNRIVRLLADGGVDPSFNPGTGANNTVRAVLVLPDGKIIVGGSFTTFNDTPREYLARLNADGSLDSSFIGPNFGGDSGWRVESLALQPDGKLLVGGSFYFSGANFKAGLCRVETTGALDATFSGVVAGAHLDGSTSDIRTVRQIVVEPDGRLLIVGNFTAFNNTPRGGVARLSATGALDSSFALTTNGEVNAILRLPDGNVLLGGTFTTVSGVSASRVALLSATGTVNTSFAAAGGHGSTVDALVFLPNGRVVLAGDVASFQGASPNRPVWQFFSSLAGGGDVMQFASATANGAEGTTVQLGVTRTGPGLGAQMVGYSTVAGSATAADFTPTSGVLTWADGDLATKFISVPLTTDALSEGAETFSVNLGQPLIGGATLGATQQVVVTINDVLAGSFAAFRQTHFTAGELADAAISGAAADPDADGLTNLMEFALGLNPRVASVANLPVVSRTGEEWVFTYTRPAERTGITYAVETSTALTSWSTSGVTHVRTATGATETWRASVPLSAGDKVFFRLKVEQP
ncbi:MAG: Calx-beta domain-containing protein [Candidatus Didemnitutus sp.]|nr:Calx-beta domain-containing protein [Candidatus Didemnitutus sp.]